MPRFDGTGPQGNGPMTGRKMGRCFNNSEQQPNIQQDVQQPFCNRGFGMGIGRKQGRCMLRIRGNR